MLINNTTLLAKSGKYCKDINKINLDCIRDYSTLINRDK